MKTPTRPCRSLVDRIVLKMTANSGARLEVCTDYRFSGVGRLLAVLALLVAASCAVEHAQSVTDHAAAVPEEKPVSLFQRWLDRYGVPLEVPQGGKSIVVNVPAYQLVAFENGEPVLRSRIIVGTPRNPTPIIDTYVTSVRFRPSWRPTPEMVASGEYADRRWPPGRNNPLGLAAIRLEPGLLVYLHDTSRRGLFDRDTRALSHGCIRVQRWDELIAWLLDMDVQTVRRWANGRRTFDEPALPVPVLIRYLTSFPDDQGELEHFEDIYRRGASPLAPDATSDGGHSTPRPLNSTSNHSAARSTTWFSVPGSSKRCVAPGTIVNRSAT